IVGFPKSGNTWMQSIMTSIMHGINTETLDNNVIQNLSPDVYSFKYYYRFINRCFFKTHELPNPTYKNVIYIVRDGRDALVSYYHYNKAQGTHYTIDEMISEGKGLFNVKWHVHTEQWVKNPYSANIIFVRYEDLINSPLQERKKICQ